ncbi:MAG: hypothetical protein ACHQF3_07700, partial [Alphaproteobacteria bacterium]
TRARLPVIIKWLRRSLTRRSRKRRTTVMTKRDVCSSWILVAAMLVAITLASGLEFSWRSAPVFQLMAGTPNLQPATAVLE